MSSSLNICSGASIHDVSKASIFALFGGEEKFRELPELHIGDRMSANHHINFIEPNELTAPIMRGKDKFNRIFFVLRGKFTNSEELICQTFFQRVIASNSQESGSNCWITASKNIIQLEGALIVQGNIRNKIAYDMLAKLINERKAEVPSISSDINQTFHLE